MTDERISDAAEDSAAGAAEVAAEAGQEGAQPGAVAFPYSTAGAAFTSWFNDRVRRLHSATLKLGTKTATVKELHADGRLECRLHASAGEAEELFVAFEPAHLDQLLLKFAAQGS
ncbi:MAG TPA: hypothetical protein VF668_19715 [Pyrinomonadaceae bacterium]|jgi:uncharacterized protein YodC (DUF2158 family)